MYTLQLEQVNHKYGCHMFTNILRIFAKLKVKLSSEISRGFDELVDKQIGDCAHVCALDLIKSDNARE